ncbi:RdgB/HAM1 family non-canonical purine NTP pyrophosphatase [Nordella sp. HKS 07]|nr:RdgB/HAM1 family non-canonical purine NTP pyrophosphatase [Nordella sp. HKS 07]
MRATAILETILYGEDIAAMRRFYEGVIGLEVRRELEDQFVFFHCGDGMLLVFNQVASAVKPKSFTSAPPHGATGAGHVCFSATAGELARWRQHLSRHGIALEADFEWSGGGHSIYCRDPAGNSVEFAEPRIWGLPERFPPKLLDFGDKEARQQIRSLRDQKLVVASHNPGKVKEINELLGPYGVEAISAASLGLPEPEETGETFEANAELKSRAAADGAKLVSLADDSGLCVEALGGDPGIYSARWAGPSKDFVLAMRNVEEKLQAIGATTPEQRRAYFVSVLSVAWPDGQVENFEGRVWGTLVWPPRGKRGFGYDPMFLPDGRQETFGEMDPDAKHEISHRAVAFRKLVDALF